MGNKYEEVFLRMKTMDSLIYDQLEELQHGVHDLLGDHCYKLRMCAEWMMGTVGPTSKTYPEFAKLRDRFLEFEELLTLNDEKATVYVSRN